VKLTRVGRWRRVVAGALIVAALVATTAVTLAATGTRDDLRSVATLMVTFRDQLAAGDVGSARATLTALREHTGAARADTSGWLWRLAAHAPVVGDDAAAVSTAAGVLDDLARDALPALIDVMADVDPHALVPRGGRVDVGALTRAAPRLVTAAKAVRRARDRIAAIDADGLIPAVRTAITGLRAELERAAGPADVAARVATVLPAMLGATRPRTYLVLFQNLAEVRATGGAPNAYAVVRADRGRIRFVGQGTAAADLRSFPAPVLPLEPAMRALYSERLGKFPADVNFTPHFPTAARLAREMYRQRSGATVDGVLATDPVALAHLLRATGPLRLPSGAVMTSGNAVRLLLSDVYAALPSPAAQDAFFAGAAKATFERLLGERLDPAATVAALARAAEERRILVWSADPAEQSAIAGTVLEGALPEHDGDRPTIGVFLNDGTGAKLSYYLTGSITVRAGTCRADGRRLLRVAIRLRSSAPKAGLSPSVVGTLGLVPRYTTRTNVMIFSPVGGAIGAVRHDGRPGRLGGGWERGRAVGVVRVDLRPGQASTLEADVLAGAAPARATGGYIPRLWTTPTVSPWSITVDSATNCTAVR
jgi:hypothetical protein